MTSLDDLLAQTAPPERPDVAPVLPKGWEPGFAWDGRQGTITTAPRIEPPDGNLWAELIADWDLDPGTVETVGPVRVKGWDSPVKGTKTGEKVRLKSYSVNIVKRTDDKSSDRADVEALCKAALRKTRAPKKPSTTVDDRALVVCLSDFQMGKGEGGGSAATVDRIKSAMAEVINHVKELRRSKRCPSVIYLAGMGDLIEGCAGHYASQTFTVDLNRREQLRVVRRLILAFVDDLAPLVERIVLAAVPGNHGENRNAAGKAFTTVDDNDDLAVFEQVAEILAVNAELYGHVSTVIADDYAMTLDIAGVPVGFFHGHITGGGGSPAAKIENWWKGQIVGMRPSVKDARILVTAHYHHLVAIESTGRTHLQCPAMDGGSHWYTSLSGQSSPAGMLTFMAGTGCGPRGWDELRIF